MEVKTFVIQYVFNPDESDFIRKKKESELKNKSFSFKATFSRKSSFKFYHV